MNVYPTQPPEHLVSTTRSAAPDSPRYEIHGCALEHQGAVTSLIARAQAHPGASGVGFGGEGHNVFPARSGRRGVNLVVTMGSKVVGYLALSVGSPDSGWTAAELAEPSLALDHLIPDPDAELRIDILTAWTLDFAFRSWSELRWVRCTADDQRRMTDLVRLGWDPVRPARGSAGRWRHLMQRRPEPLAPNATGIVTSISVPALPRWVAEAASGLGTAP